MYVAVVSGIKREQSDRILRCQLFGNMVTANLPASIQWDQAANFHPENFHLSVTSRFLRSNRRHWCLRGGLSQDLQDQSRSVLALANVRWCLSLQLSFVPTRPQQTG